MHSFLVDVLGASTEDHINLIAYPRNGQTNQTFRYENGFIVTHCGKVLDVSGGSLVPGAKVIQYARHGGANQKWEFHNDGTIRVAGTILCLDIEGCSRSQKANLVVNPQNGQDSQKWKIVTNESGGCCNNNSGGQSSTSPTYNPRGEHYFLVSDLNGLVLDVMGNSTADRTGLHMWTKTGAANQKFSFQNGMIFCGHSGKVLDVEGGNLKSGANVMQFPPHGGPNQKWEIHKDGTIRVAGTDLCLDIQGEVPDKGQRIHIWGHHGRANQRWRLVK